MALAQGSLPPPPLERLIDFCSQDRLCPGVAGKVPAAGHPPPSHLPPLLRAGRWDQAGTGGLRGQTCCQAVTPVSSGWSFHRLRGSCLCGGREEPVPWRNRIWVDARDMLGGGGRGVEQSGPGSYESLDLLTYVLEAFPQPWGREPSSEPVGRASSRPAPLGTRGGWDPVGRDSCGDWT